MEASFYCGGSKVCLCGGAWLHGVAVKSFHTQAAELRPTWCGGYPVLCPGNAMRKKKHQVGQQGAGLLGSEVSQALGISRVTLSGLLQGFSFIPFGPLTHLDEVGQTLFFPSSGRMYSK